MLINVEDLQVGHTYLIKRYSTVHSITILLITGTSLKLRWNNENNPRISWEEKRELNYFNIIEDISDFITTHNEWVTTEENIILKYETELKECDLCFGLGTIPDSELTSGVKSCPKCFGSKMVVNKIKQV